MRLMLIVGLWVGMIPAIAVAESKEEQVAKYINDLKNANAKVRATAAEEIGRIGEVKAVYGKPAVKPLLETLGDKEPQVRAAVVTALSKLDEPKEVVPALTKVVKDDKELRVRIAAAQGLGHIGPAAKEALPTLKDIRDAAMKDEKTRQLGQAVARAMQAINGRR